MKVSVIGVGHVGAVAATSLASAGHDVIGIDVVRDLTVSLGQGRISFHEPGLPELLTKGLETGNLRFLHADDVSEPLGDAIVITTGTPMSGLGTADLSQIKSAIEWATKRSQAGGLVVMKSTVPPGTGARLQETLLAGTNIGYVSSPEFLREGQAVSDWSHPDRVVVGLKKEKALTVVKELYRGIEAPYVVTDITSAELIKYSANAFLATKISFINEIANLCDRVGASIDDVIDGISLDPRISPSFLRPGVGYGGSCFPKDVRALDHVALTNGHDLELLRSVITVNNRQRFLPHYELREHFGRLEGVNICVLGLSFKPDTDDVRESPAIDLIPLLLEDGALVSAYDPKAIPAARKALPEAVEFVDDLLECAKGKQAFVLMTEWSEIVNADWAQVCRHATEPRFLFDGRNALDREQMKALGFAYRGVGRNAGAAGVTAGP